MLLEARIGPVMPRHGVMSVHEWIADALMALFFLLVGLEVKREWYQGRLSTAAERRLPIIAAIAGMAVPALVYLAVTRGDPALANGWAIPAATDIAFAIGVLAILGRHAPPAIKLLLVTLAIIDDIGAVIIIALAYTADLDRAALAGALAVAGGDGGDGAVRGAAAGAVPRRLRPAVAADAGERGPCDDRRRARRADHPARHGRGQVAAAAARTCHPSVGDVRGRALVRAGLGRGRAERRDRSARRAAAARHPARAVRRQAARRVRAIYAVVRLKLAPMPRGDQLAPIVGRGVPVRDRLHDEPVHRRARLPRQPGAGRGGQDRHARRIAAVGAGRLPHPAHRPAGGGNAEDEDECEDLFAADDGRGRAPRASRSAPARS